MVIELLQRVCTVETNAMITKIEIDGFKTFNNFKIELSPFVIIAGANGSGKSNLFDAILLLSRLAETDLKSAFQEQRGEAREQLNPVKLRKPSPILAKDFIGADGSNLPAALARMKAEDLYVTKDISREINNLLPGITAIDVEEDRSKDQYVLISISQDGRKFSSRVLSEGTLRVLALLVFKLDLQHKGVLCFEVQKYLQTKDFELYLLLE